MAHNEWSYDTAQPPLVYTAKVGGKRTRSRLGRDDGGRLVRLRRRDRPADLPARQGDRPHRAPARSSRASRWRSSRRRSAASNYSPASYDPQHELRLQRARPRRPRSMMQAKLTPTQKQRKLHARRRLPRPRERQLRRAAPGLARPRLDQRDRRQHGQAGLEVPDAGARARRRHDDGERPRLRRRRRRRLARVRPEDRQGALDVPDRPPDRGRRRRSTRSTARSTSRSPSGGTPTSSGGGTATRAAGLRARRLAERSRRRRTCRRSSARQREGARVVHGDRARAASAARVARARGRPGARIVTQAGLVVQPWNAELVERRARSSGTAAR